MKNTTTSSNS